MIKINKQQITNWNKIKNIKATSKNGYSKIKIYPKIIIFG